MRSIYQLLPTPDPQPPESHPQTQENNCKSPGDSTAGGLTAGAGSLAEPPVARKNGSNRRSTPILSLGVADLVGSEGQALVFEAVPPAQKPEPEPFRLVIRGGLPTLRSIASSLAIHACIIAVLGAVKLPSKAVEKPYTAEPTEIEISGHLYYVAQISGRENDDSKLSLPPALAAGKSGPFTAKNPFHSKASARSAAPEPAPNAARAQPAKIPALTVIEAPKLTLADPAAPAVASSAAETLKELQQKALADRAAAAAAHAKELAAKAAAAQAAAAQRAIEDNRAILRRELTKTFIPPEVKRSPTAAQTLIQPLSPPDLAPPPVQLPSFRAVTTQFPRIPRKFVVPGSNQPKPPAQMPEVAAPNLQIAQANRTIDVQAKLPLLLAPPPPEQPKQAPEGPPPQPQGDPISILSLNDRNIPIPDKLVIPPGNIAQEPGMSASSGNGAASSATLAGAGSASATSSAANSPSGTAAGVRGAQAVAETATKRGSGAGTPASNAAASAVSGTGNNPAAPASAAASTVGGRGTSAIPTGGNTAPNGVGAGNSPVARLDAPPGAGNPGAMGTGTGNGSSGIGSTGEGNGRSTVGSGSGAALTGGTNAPGANPTTAVGGAGGNGRGTGSGGGAGTGQSLPGEVISRPRDGKFDAVVVQASPVDQYPETRGLLTGRPIYSVYIPAGTSREWTLFYCVPNEKALAAQGNVVKLGPPAAPIQAPYPYKFVRPATTLPSYEKYVLIHGFINAEGRFENVKLVRSILPEIDRTILASLGQWEFRPAMKDGAPIAVEFLLSIPAKGL